MIKEDSNRLLKAFLISVIAHAFIFVGINWFKESDMVSHLSPVTLRIEMTNQTTNLVGKKQIPVVREAKAPVIREIKAPVQEKLESETSALLDSILTDTSVKAEFDPYANLSISSISNSATPVQDELYETVPDYVPTGGNIVNLEEIEPMAESELVSSKAVIETKETQIVSGEVIGKLETALTKEAGQSYSISSDPSNKNIDLYEWLDSPVKFKHSGVNRKLISDASINISPDILENILSERTIVIGFSLDDNGLLHGLNIERSSGYTILDSAIISEIRMWKFDSDPGSEDLEGTVTILLKGR